MEQLAKIIEASALQLVMIDSDDLQGLAGIHTHFEQIAQIAADLSSSGGNVNADVKGDDNTPAPPDSADLELIQTASVKAAELISKLILSEVEDAAATLNTINKTSASLQSLMEQLSQGQKPTHIKFPPELGLETTDNLNSNESQPENISPESCSSSQGPKISLPDNVDEEIFREFLSSQPHVLENLESAILTAEKDPSAGNYNAIKGILHNLKGESSLMGLQEFAAVCHETESLLENSETNEPDQFPAEKLLAAKDWLTKAVAQLSNASIGKESTAPSGPSEQQKRTDQNTTNDTDSEPAGDTAPNEPDTAEQPEPEEKLKIAEGDAPLVMDFISESSEHLESAEADLLHIEECPDDPETINSIFRAFHTIKGVAGFLNLKQIGSLAHVAENLLDEARKEKIILGGSSVDTIFESIDVMKQMFSALQQAVENDQHVQPYQKLQPLIDRIKQCTSGKSPPIKLGEVIVQEGTASAAEVRDALHEQQTSSPDKKIGEILVDKKVVTEQQIDKALQDQKLPPAARSNENKKIVNDTTVKVTTGRLDSLINMVGELVIAQSMVSQGLDEHIRADQRLARNVRHLDKITRELQELSMSMRMVPVQGVFQKMARLVRDLSRKAGKDIEFVMTGAETELDRNVVEAIADPLVHMVRNSVDHGVETPEERSGKGKPPQGRVELKAFHQGGNIVIEICDDGKGLNREKILEKAIACNIVKEGQELSDGEIYRLVFHAGLSTAEKITDVSGRGVGMDVVRKNIESLRGRIDIESTIDKGSTFSIRLPLTLAVIDGQVVNVGKETYVIPSVSIEHSIRPQPEQLKTVQGARGEMVMIRGKLLPLVKLYRLFGIESELIDPCEALIVVVTDGDNRCCVQVDSLLGQQQVVIKSLGDYLGSIKGVSGAAIMGDGNVSLIVDVPGLISLAAGK
jgi:two-component system, chemotaxis family, sensor kinase CheA